jgi:hypothetical protein
MTRYYSATALDTSLTTSITTSNTSIVVGATTGYPSSYPFVLALDYNSASEELVLVTAASGLTLTVTRAYNGTTAQNHTAGALIRHVITAQDLTDTQVHYATTLAQGAHGVTGSLATFFGTPSSANFAAALTDETGSGSAVFSSGPTISTPSITGGTINSATVTGTNLTDSGNTFPSAITLSPLLLIGA